MPSVRRSPTANPTGSEERQTVSEALVAPAPPRWLSILPWIFWVAAVVEAGLIGFAPLIFPQQFAPTSDETIESAAFVASIALVVMAFATAGLLISFRAAVESIVRDVTGRSR
jgi:hypothetical protein